MKERLKKEGNEIVTNLHGLKMYATDGKMRITDAPNTKQHLHIIQSIPSPKAEPFQQWLAKIGSASVCRNSTEGVGSGFIIVLPGKTI